MNVFKKFHDLFTYQRLLPLQNLALKRSWNEQYTQLGEDFFQVVKIWVVLFLLGIGSLPFSRTLFNNYPDQGYMISKIIGLAIFSYVNWFMVSTRVLSFTGKNIVYILTFLSIVLYGIFPFSLREFNVSKIIIDEVIFFFIFVALCYLRGFRPEIWYKTEGYMDFGFFNSTYRSRNFPPKDPWFAGKTINYYWYGYYVIAYLGKLAQIPVGTMYNIGLAVPIVLAFIGLYSFSNFFFVTLLKSNNFFLPFIPPIISLFGVSLHYPYLVYKSIKRKTKCWLFYINSIIPKTINEHPHYSFVNGNLRGHLINLIFGVLLFNACIQILFQPLNFFLIIMIALCLAISYMTNSSDLATWGLLYLLVTITRYLYYYDIQLIYLIAIILISLALLIFFLVPFLLHFKSFFGRIHLLFRSDTSAQDAVMIWGVWFLVLGLYFINHSIKEIPLVNIFFIICAIFIALLIFLMEFFYIPDIHKVRANTFYKLNHIVNLILPFVGSIILFGFFGQVLFPFKLVFLLLIIINLFLLTYFPFLAYQWFASLNPKKYVGLDVYQTFQNKPNDKVIADYLLHYRNKHTVILESTGESYTDNCSMSIFSAIPTIIGWKAHEWLWRSNLDIVRERQKHVKEIYETPLIHRKSELLEKYHVSYIVFSDRETKAYPKIDASLFETLGIWVINEAHIRLLKVNNT